MDIVERLRDYIPDGDGYNSEYAHTLDEAADEIARLRDENAKLRADAERLDWLDEINRQANEWNGTAYGWKLDINHNRAALTDHNIPALSIRAAIDAAMQKGE